MPFGLDRRVLLKSCWRVHCLHEVTSKYWPPTMCFNVVGTMLIVGDYRGEGSMVPSIYHTCSCQKKMPSSYNNNMWYESIKERHCEAFPHGVRGSLYKESYPLKPSLLILGILTTRTAVGIVGVDKLCLFVGLWLFFMELSARTAISSRIFFMTLWPAR